MSVLTAPLDFAHLVDAGIAKPGRYLGNERGVVQRDWDQAAVRWALTYPELYEVGASNIGHIILYSILNAQPRQLCDRAYLPAPDLASRLRAAAAPLFAVESRRSLASFHILGFSLSYELGATNVLEMLDLAGIPLRALNRGDLPLNHPDAPPLIFAGGQTATGNPEPYAVFFDFIALGDGEELLPEIGLVLEEAIGSGLSRTALLADLAAIPGVYVPSFKKQRVVRRTATPMPHYAMALVPNVETVHDRLTVEIRRGCTRGCRFCQPGMLTRPARDVDPKEVVEAVETGMIRTGYSDFSLLSLSCSDYLALPAVGVELRNRLQDHNVSLALPSQRIDRFDSNIAHILGGTKQGSLTFAPEAGSQRLRDIINKGLTDADLIEGVRTAMRHGWRKLKLYFMIGLPGETDADVDGIANTVEMLRYEMRDIGRLELNLTISNFTPKPHTPFQWHSVSSSEFLRRQQLLKKRFGQMDGLKVNFTDVRLSAMEDFIGRGDQSLGEVIEAAWRAGAGMDAWFDNIEHTYTAWKWAIEAAGLGGRYRDLELGSWAELQALSPNQRRERCAEPLPWDHIDTGVSKQWLQDDLERALTAEQLPDCSFASCSHCGVCGEGLGHNVVLPAPEVPPIAKPRKPPSNQVARLRVCFAKTADMALLSHLDLVRILDRALRRARLPVSFSGGFHPLPRLQLALALPLGAEAWADWFDLSLSAEIEAETFIELLQAQLPPGLDLKSAQQIPVHAPALSQSLHSAKWRLKLGVASALVCPRAEDWQEALGELLVADHLPIITKDRIGRLKQKDLQPYLLDLHWYHWQTNGVEIGLESRVENSGRSLKPNQLLQLLEQRLGVPLLLEHQIREALNLAC
jgi:radical SAM-linked protein